MRRTFLDPQLDADFDEYGFVVVPFLDADGIAELTALYWEDGPAPDDPRTSIFFDFQSKATEFKVDRAAKPSSPTTGATPTTRPSTPTPSTTTTSPRSTRSCSARARRATRRSPR